MCNQLILHGKMHAGRMTSALRFEIRVPFGCLETTKWKPYER
jgi:hypothetical protein